MYNMLKAATLSLQIRRSKGIKYAPCCAALIPCTLGFSLKRALPDANFTHFDSATSKKEFLHFQGRLRKRTGKYAD